MAAPTDTTRKPGEAIEIPDRDVPDAEVALTERAQQDYFGFDDKFQVVLPDGKSVIDHKKLNEGSKRKYLNKVNREVNLDRKTGNAKIQTAPGDEREILLKSAIVGWNLVKNGEPVQFSEHNLNDFLNVADPKIVDIIEKDIRKKNAWLLQDMTVEAIDDEIKDLQELRQKLVEEEEAKNA